MNIITNLAAMSFWAVILYYVFDSIRSKSYVFAICFALVILIVVTNIFVRSHFVETVAVITLIYFSICSWYTYTEKKELEIKQRIKFTIVQTLKLSALTVLAIIATGLIFEYLISTEPTTGSCTRSTPQYC